MIDLMNFCYPEIDVKLQLAMPFSRGDFTYASDGSIIVRVPRMAAYPDDRGPILTDDLVFEPNGRDSVRLVKPLPYTYEACEDCGCFCGNIDPFEDCPWCNGTGWVISNKAIPQENGFMLNQVIIKKIQDLNGLKVFLPIPGKDISSMIGYFEFSDGCGLFMGMKT